MSLKDKAKNLAREIDKEADVIRGERSKDKVYSSERKFADEESARLEFVRAKERLFDANSWSDIPGIGTANFKIYNPAGTPTDHKIVMVGDFLKIDLPGPVPHYWVEVTDLREEKDVAEFTVKPAHDPTDSSDPEVIDHFFQEDARSTFRVERSGNTIRGFEIGTDEAINNQGKEAGDQAVVNTIVSETGWAIFQKNQWKSLTDYLVGNTKTK